MTTCENVADAAPAIGKLKPSAIGADRPSSSAGKKPVGASVTVRITHPDTVDHLELYEQAGDATFRLAGRYPADTTSLPLPDGRAGTYFIKAVGKPFIENVVSAAIVVR